MPKTSFLQKKERNRPFLAKVTDSLPGQKAEVTSQIKLPKLDLPTFDGDILHWQDFWECSILQYMSKKCQRLSSLVI